MTERRWKLVVTELGRSDALHAVVVEAGDWMTALGRARAIAGERGGVPPGASCAVDAGGTVTILDGVARRQYQLVPTSEEATGAPATAAAAAGAGATKKKVSKQTVAYMQSPLAAAGVALLGGAPVAGAQPAQAAAKPAPAAAPAPAASAAAPASAPAAAAARPASVPAPAAVSVPKPASVPPGAAAAELAKSKSKQTVAYVPPAQAAATQPAPTPPAAAAQPATPAVVTPQPAQSPQAATDPSPPAATEQGPAAARKKVSKQTVAYLPSAPELLEHAKNAAAAAPAQSATASTAATAGAEGTATPAIPAVTDATATPATPVAPAAPAPPVAAEPAIAPAAPSVPADGAEVLYARDGEPTAETPLTYRERTFVVATGTSADDAEMIVRRRFAALREELEVRPKGKLVNMAVFDHRWEGRPSRPPLVALQWKDWRGEPEIQRPTAIASTPPPAISKPPVSQAPAAQAAPSTPAPATATPAARQRLSTPGPDDRLTHAFESLQDLFFLGSPLEGADFVLNLLGELVPCEASSVCLYDINTDELRFVALRGAGADERKGEAIPLGLGLIGAAAELSRPMLVEEVGSDPRFDPGIDGRVGLDPSTMALVPIVHQGRLQAVVQLVNRQGQAQFGKADANVLVYVGEKLGEFLQQSRLAPQPSPSQRAPRR